jgi:hypothetical protein
MPNHQRGCLSPVGGPLGPKKSTTNVDFTTNAKSSSRMSLPCRRSFRSEKNRPQMLILQPMPNHHLGCLFAAEAAPTKRINQPPMLILQPMPNHQRGIFSHIGCFFAAEAAPTKRTNHQCRPIQPMLNHPHRLSLRG